MSARNEVAQTPADAADSRVEAAAAALWEQRPMMRTADGAPRPWADVPAWSYGARYRGQAQVALAAADAVDSRQPRTVTTAEELDAAIVRAFEEGENLVLLDGWRPWIIWENEQGDIRVSSLPVEDDPDHLSLSDVSLPAVVLSEPEAEATA